MTRATYYLADEDGYLLSTVFLTEEEVPHYTGLLTEPPPSRPVVELTPSDESRLMWEIVRRQRDQMLAATDWVVARAVERGIPISHGWATYRQALRDIPLLGDPYHITWPQRPA